MSKLKTIALFGGTFDPIHNGHLNSAIELSQKLPVDELRLVPCSLPPHRQSPGVSAEHRLQMARLAVQSLTVNGQGDKTLGGERLFPLSVDGRELNRQGPSYSIDTVEALRAEHNEPVSISWVMGADAFASFDQWHRWQDWLQLAHIIVMARPGYQLPEQGALATLAREHQAADFASLTARTAGNIFLMTLTPYDISASQIRSALTAGRSVADYLPARVLSYIEKHDLYHSGTNGHVQIQARRRNDKL